jgi:hypothetical protein
MMNGELDHINIRNKQNVPPLAAKDQRVAEAFIHRLGAQLGFDISH